MVAASGSALPGDLATEWMDAFGDNLYNTYGSTECAWVTIAQPAEMRDRPRHRRPPAARYLGRTLRRPRPTGATVTSRGASSWPTRRSSRATPTVTTRP
ncbi:MAG: hypothetical protein WKF83_00180 [Nocardioidaceae bacterium]